MPDAPVASDDVRALLQSVVAVARAIFGAAASSVFLLDEARRELVFQAVAGEGEDFLVGTRFPADRGIAGWVASSGQAMIADELSNIPTFARDLAESTRYVPSALMAAPLLSEGRVLGVLEVLDPVPQSRSDLADLDLLSLFAHQAALALRVARTDAGDTGGTRSGEERAEEVEERLVGAMRDFLRVRSR
ncbi:GAF domain-containing protein [Streptomyces sp. 4N509B]|uniref:GAF domain-containing protein n=1 Tax=Streptomyces sp. 4N509B TaxID=3457413 RepID=UPI003FD26792